MKRKSHDVVATLAVAVFLLVGPGFVQNAGAQENTGSAVPGLSPDESRRLVQMELPDYGGEPMRSPTEDVIGLGPRILLGPGVQAFTTNVGATGETGSIAAGLLIEIGVISFGVTYAGDVGGLIQAFGLSTGESVIYNTDTNVVRATTPYVERLEFPVLVTIPMFATGPSTSVGLRLGPHLGFSLDGGGLDIGANASIYADDFVFTDVIQVELRLSAMFFEFSATEVRPGLRLDLLASLPLYVDSTEAGAFNLPKPPVLFRDMRRPSVDSDDEVEQE